MADATTDREVVRTAVVDAALVVTIDRPAARNALNREVAEALARAFDRLDADAGLRVGVLTGAGPGFCSGLDLAEFAGDGSGTSELLRRLMRDGTRKPLIAAVEGFAVAGGFELVLTCDLVVAARGSRFALPEVKRSLVANAGGLLRLGKRIPFHVACEIGLTGGFVGAERLHALGLVNRLTDEGAALDTALALAREVCANAPLAVLATKEILALEGDQNDWARQDAIADPVFGSADAREGARAFVERRPPRWAAR